MLLAVTAAAALIALLAFAPFASAASDPLASGTTTLTLNKGFFKKLKKNDVKVLKVSPGTVNNRTVTLPVSGGSLDPTTGLGTVNVSGGLKFKNGKKQVPLKNLIFNSTTKVLTGTVGKKQMKIASLNGLSFVRNGFGVDVGVTKLRLTENAAKQLNKQLGFSSQSTGSHKRATTSSADSANVVFKKNQVAGSSASLTQPKTVTILPTGNATLAGSVPTLLKFGSKGVPIPAGITGIAPATKPTATSFLFPISGGTLAPDLSSGTLNTSGGVQVAKPAGATMQITNISVDFATKVALTDLTILPTPGSVGRASLADIVMTGATVTVDPTARTFTVTGAVANIQAVAAATLNATFPGGVDFVAGDPFGTFSFTAQAQ